MQTLNITYPKWKQVRASLTLQVYYVQSVGLALDVVLVDLGNQFIYVSHIVKSGDITDFVTNIQPTASLQISIDDCIASAVVH
jgi:hypothetical protein